jgi:general nucleoside transport system permease protein
MILVPLISLLLAFLVSGLVMLAIGETRRGDADDGRWRAGLALCWGYTLYYATSFIFTGLAVAVAFHAGLFNIGGEGQAQLGGLGVALVCLCAALAALAVALVAAMPRGGGLRRGLGA